MSLPPGFLDELHGRLSLAQVVGRKVSWDQNKSNMGKGDYWASCPFHQEKTASFHVDDPKGFYYCFGCQAKGDAINFVQETENVGFMEAIEILAREAGMQMPTRDPQAKEKADQRAVLFDVMEQSAQFFRLQLQTKLGGAAREYLQKRGLTTATLEQFEIGFAPSDSKFLYNHLTGKGAKTENIVTSGMCVKPDDERSPYDRFRDRIMFPIRDARGRCIAFGGRAMAGDAPAKYLNSPETPLFHKGRSLYNLGPARVAAGKAGGLIVVEGYMDVIALAQAGLAHAIAPLGTAITEDQLQLMWRVNPEPVIALDGDAAGLRAAVRLVDLSLPLLEAGKSLRFCLLPEGKDPDDLIKTGGAIVMEKLIEQAVPMVDILWQRETQGQIFDSPERRAALDASLRKTLNLISDRAIKSHYGEAIRKRRAELFGNKPREPWKPGNWKVPKVLPASTGVKSSMLAQNTTSEQAAARLREAVILAAAIQVPSAVIQTEAELERCPFFNPDLEEIRNALLENLHFALAQEDPKAALCATVETQLGFDPVKKLQTMRGIRLRPYLCANTDPEKTRQALTEELAKHIAVIGAAREIQEAEQDLEGLADEGVTWRLQQAAETRENATRSKIEGDDMEDEEAVNLSKHLQNLINSQD